MPFGLTGNYFLYFTSTDPSVAADACTALPSSTPSLTSRVVVVRRGGCDFAVKLANLAKAGAKIVLIYNSPNTLTLPQFNVGSTGLTAVGGLRYEDGVKVRPRFAASRTCPLRKSDDRPPCAHSSSSTTTRRRVGSSSRSPLARSFQASSTASLAEPSRAYSSALRALDPSLTLLSERRYYSSYGATNDLTTYPSLAAPGTNILSTVAGGLGIMRGTSQSSPLVGAYRVARPCEMASGADCSLCPSPAAGAYALILAQRKSENLTPQQLKSLFMTTSVSAPNTFGSSTPDSIVSQGAGRIDVGAALAAKTLISPSELNLNDTANSNRMQRITLTNRNSEAVTYTFSSSFAQGIVTYNNARYSLASRVPLRREPDTTFDVTGRLERRDPLDDPQ